MTKGIKETEPVFPHPDHASKPVGRHRLKKSNSYTALFLSWVALALAPVTGLAQPADPPPLPVDEGEIVEQGEVKAPDLSAGASGPATDERCGRGDAEACTILGLSVTEFRDSVAPDYAAAHKYYVKACRLEHGPACALLAGLYKAGNGVEQDSDKYLEYLGDACSKAHAESCRNLGEAWFYGDGVDEDPTRSRTLFETACEWGDAMSCLW